MFWNSWITVIFESFLIVSLCAMITIKYNFEFAPWGQTVQTVSTITTISIYTALPLLAFYKTMRHFKDLKSRGMKQAFGTLYQSLDISQGRRVLLHPLSFLIRRLVLAYLVVAGTKVLIYQIMILVWSAII